MPFPEQTGASLPRLVTIMQRLLAKDGCPWDREQSPQSLRRYVLEEAYEVVDAIDQNDPSALCEELGDLLLQIVFQAEIARAAEQFGPDDVVASICEKLVRRHPHVFGDAEAKDPEEVHRMWARIKAQEKGSERLLEKVPRALPALARAQRVGQKVERVGFDWPDTAGSRAKVDEELGELDAAIAANDPTAIAEELGDTLFALVNLARHVGVDAELALRGTTDKFSTRFAHVEDRVREQHGGFGMQGDAEHPALPLDVLDGYWEEAKRERRGA